MIYNGQEIEFPAIIQTSFFKLIEKLEVQAKGDDIAGANYAKELLKEVEKYPELRDGISDINKLDKYKESIDILCKPMFPEVLTDNEIKMLTPPLYFEPLYTSKRFKKIIEASGEPFSFMMKDLDADTFYLYCCYFILGSYYGYPVAGSIPKFFQIENKSQGIRRVYKLLINTDMSEFEPTDKAVEIKKEDFEELIDNFGDMKLWKKKFPPNSWIMKGVNVINFVDVTADQSITSISSSLLVAEVGTFEKIEWGIKKLLNNSGLAIGLLSIENNYLYGMQKRGINSLLLEKGETLNCDAAFCDYSLQTLIKNKEPLVITDVKKFHSSSPSNFSKRLLKSDYESYILAPSVHEDKLLGFMEIGSGERYELHKGSLNILNQVMPIISTAKRRFHTEAQNLIEAIIQQECTTIHQSVKWKFEEEAKKFIEQQQEQPEFRDIVFDHLYPLYGQLDIKGSSERRNKAVAVDLIKQLKGVDKVLKTANEKKKMPLYEELIFRVSEFIGDLKEDLTAGSEHRILTFLKEEVYPVFHYLQKMDESIRPHVEMYYALLDKDMHTVYEERKKYDISVNTINQHLASFLDKRQMEAQQMFPHYFERYKTDGVEFNMYIGQSITKKDDFDPIFVRNLRLWQLLTICEMENEYYNLKNQLASPIEIASLILVYNTPISVHFRTDEKKFDVEGAYNARYEIIKKRVDKAHIKGTNERITQPGSIVIVYSQESDAPEYRTYLNYLVSKGYLKGEVEDFQLEDLQGVHGLRALRVAVNYSSGNLTVDEFIREMEQA
ncbi:MAG: GAF domain-containing protein [Ekhidna sp.]|nr:GAF domain-containing protein [Ekhidna sp.]